MSKEPEPFPADLDIKSHIKLAQLHLQAAHDLAYGSQPQPFWVRTQMGRAQSIIISLLVRGKIKS